VTLRIADHFASSDTGRARRVNEDSLLADPPVFVVADGMGGAQAGEVASRLAIEAFEAGLPDDGSPEERLAARAHEANAAIYELAHRDEDRAGMGTTLTAALVGEGEVSLAHVGDSRAYLLRDGELRRLTRDHSLVQEFVDQGKLTEQQAAEHPQRSIITRALGPESSVHVDGRTYSARDGDVFLLCSDGLTSMIGEEEVRGILAGAAALHDAGEALIDAANAAGGRDNITVVLFRVAEAADGRAGAGAGATSEQPRVHAAHGEQETGVIRAAEPAAARAAAGTAVRPRAEPSADPAPRPGGPDRQEEAPGRRRRLGALVVVLLVLLPLLVGGWLASRAVYFVGTNENGLVTLYRGLPYDLPAGLTLYETYYVSGVPAREVPPDRRETLLDHQLRSQDDASDLVRQLELGRLDP
jgi:PPM family protein phosphatase